MNMGIMSGKDQSAVSAMKTLTSPQLQDPPIEHFLNVDVYTNPMFKKDRKNAEKLMNLRYEE